VSRSRGEKTRSSADVRDSLSEYRTNTRTNEESFANHPRDSSSSSKRCRYGVGLCARTEIERAGEKKRKVIASFALLSKHSFEFLQNDIKVDIGYATSINFDAEENIRVLPFVWIR